MKLVFSAQEAVLDQMLTDLQKQIDAAKQGAVQDAGDLAVKQGRANIASAGFPPSWQNALSEHFYPNKGGDPAAVIFDKIPFASVFEFGATIGGKPLLWLPIEQNLPPNVHSPKQYGRKMVSVNIAGKAPMMFDKFDRLRGPLFVGVRAAHIQKRFDLLRIFAAAAARLGEFYLKRINRA